MLSFIIQIRKRRGRSYFQKGEAKIIFSQTLLQIDYFFVLSKKHFYINIALFTIIKKLYNKICSLSLFFEKNQF